MANTKTKKVRNLFITDQDLMDCVLSEESDNVNIKIKYQNDKDFDEAFKNLLRPIESIAKRNYGEPLQYNLLKELDSYLNHLRESSDGGSLVFVEAALMIQNVILIFQKRVDQIVEVLIKLIGKFRAYRRNLKQNENIDDLENPEGNNKQKKEKKVKFFPSFEPIEGQICGTLKNFDCKIINLSKKPSVPKLVLNANIKVCNKYNTVLPYILVGNGDNVGKKYDYMINWPLNRDLAVNEEFDCPTNDNHKCDVPLKYQNNGDPLPIMEIDGVETNDILPSTPDPIIFEQTVIEVLAGQTNHKQTDNNKENVVNGSVIPAVPDDNAWAPVIDDTIYQDKPIISKKYPKKEDTGTWLPMYVVGELRCQIVKIKSGISVDSVFRKLIQEVQDAQRSELAKKRILQNIAEDKKKFDYYDEDFEEKLKNGEVSGFRGFDSPIYNNEFDYNFNVAEPEVPLNDIAENFQSYQKNALDMKKHEQNQRDIMNEQLEMRKRVQQWHDNLRPILEEEEKRIQFDIHEYGTRVLNCFSFIGEQKSFKELVSGLEQEEVSRYFLSTLMMANTYNLKIIKSGAPDYEIILELLKKERHHEQLQVNIGNQVNKELN